MTDQTEHSKTNKQSIPASQDLLHADEAHDVSHSQLKQQSQDPNLSQQLTSLNNNNNQLVGKKRTASQKETTKDQVNDLSNNEDIDDKQIDSADPFAEDLDDEDDDANTSSKLFKIEKLIEQKKLTKRERRLLQNRKSALKCRLKKQSELEGMKDVVEQLNEENCKLKEKVSAMNALLMCKQEENIGLNKKFNEIQLQHSMLMIQMMQNTQQSGNTAQTNTHPNNQASLISGILMSQIQNSTKNLFQNNQSASPGVGLGSSNLDTLLQLQMLQTGGSGTGSLSVNNLINLSNSQSQQQLEQQAHNQSENAQSYQPDQNIQGNDANASEKQSSNIQNLMNILQNGSQQAQQQQQVQSNSAYQKPAQQVQPQNNALLSTLLQNQQQNQQHSSVGSSSLTNFLMDFTGGAGSTQSVSKQNDKTIGTTNSNNQQINQQLLQIQNQINSNQKTQSTVNLMNNQAKNQSSFNQISSGSFARAQSSSFKTQSSMRPLQDLVADNGTPGQNGTSPLDNYTKIQNQTLGALSKSSGTSSSSTDIQMQVLELINKQKRQQGH